MESKFVKVFVTTIEVLVVGNLVVEVHLVFLFFSFPRMNLIIERLNTRLVLNFMMVRKGQFK